MTNRPGGSRRGKPDKTGRSSGKMAGRIGELLRPPEGEPFIWLTREILTSPAYKSLGINARRVIDFLLVEHMNHAGMENGNLKATYQQLKEFRISDRYIASAIREVEAAGLVDCRRGGMRVATTYALTFYPLSDGTPPTNRWRQITGDRPPKKTEICLPKGRQTTFRREGRLPSEGKADYLPKGRQICPIYLPKGRQI